MSENKKTNPLPKNMNAALQEVMKTILGLEKIYELEIEALSQADSKSFLNLQKDKLSRATLYQSHMAQIIARQEEVAKADPAIRDQLKAVYKKFSEISDKNLKMLERMQRCTEMLGDTMRNAALRSIKSQRGYNYAQNGEFSKGKNRSISSGLSETA